MHMYNQKFKLVILMLTALNVLTHKQILGHVRPSFSSAILRIPATSSIDGKGDILNADHSNHAHTRSGRCFFSAPQTPAPQRAPSNSNNDQHNWAIDPKSSLSQHSLRYELYG